MTTFIEDENKNNSPLQDDSPEITMREKGQPIEKLIEDAEAAEAEINEEAAETEDKASEEESAEESEAVSEEKLEELIEKEFSIKEHSAKFHKGNLRNGMELKYDGSIIVLGDVNPGAEIIAEGNILVLGSLKGMAHAGCKGNTDAFVFALNLSPVQIRIANVITRFPESDSKAIKKPEFAYLEDGKIYVSSFQ